MATDSDTRPDSVGQAHTPGPWGIEQTRDMLWVGPMRPDGHKVDHVVVALNIDSQLTAAAALRQLFNSRLIAAAPDLLAALQEICDKLDTIDGQPFVNPADSYWTRARAAIAKAKGGQP